MIARLREVWRQLRRYPRGCNIEDDYLFIRSCLNETD